MSRKSSRAAVLLERARQDRVGAPAACGRVQAARIGDSSARRRRAEEMARQLVDAVARARRIEHVRRDADVEERSGERHAVALEHDGRALQVLADLLDGRRRERAPERARRLAAASATIRRGHRSRTRASPRSKTARIGDASERRVEHHAAFARSRAELAQHLVAFATVERDRARPDRPRPRRSRSPSPAAGSRAASGGTRARDRAPPARRGRDRRSGSPRAPRRSVRSQRMVASCFASAGPARRARATFGDQACGAADAARGDRRRDRRAGPPACRRDGSAPTPSSRRRL